MGVHDGHRERLKSRFAEHGLDCFNELNALELLLFYAIPRKDTNILAHELLDHFGSFDAIFEASINELMAIKGVGENTALLIKLVPQIMKKCEIAKVADLKKFEKSSELARYLIPRYMEVREEVAMLISLDAHLRMISCDVINRGTVNAVEVSTRRIVEIALKRKACHAVLTHNHPGSNNPVPSIEDERFTNKVVDALSLVDVRLRDHIIVAGQRHFSMRDCGLFKIFR